MRTGNTFRNSTQRAPPPPPANLADELDHEGEACLEQCLGGAGVCPQHCGRQGACCRADDHVDTFMRAIKGGGGSSSSEGAGAITAPAGRKLPAACRADDGTRLGCVGAHCCTRSATRVPTLELDNEGEACWAPCSERAGGCSGFCGSDGACCRRGDASHIDGVACNHGAAGCTSEHCCVHNAVKVRELQQLVDLDVPRSSAAHPGAAAPAHMQPATVHHSRTANVQLQPIRPRTLYSSPAGSKPGAAPPRFFGAARASASVGIKVGVGS